MNIIKFLTYTIIGAGIWNSFLTICGFYLKKNWETVMHYSKILDVVVLVALVAAVVYFFFNHIKRAKSSSVS